MLVYLIGARRACLFSVETKWNVVGACVSERRNANISADIRTGLLTVITVTCDTMKIAVFTTERHDNAETISRLLRHASEQGWEPVSALSCRSVVNTAIFIVSHVTVIT